MDPRVRDLAFGAALYGIGQSGGMTGNIGADLRRIGTLPPPTPLTPQAAPTAPVASMFGQDIYSGGGDGFGAMSAPGGPFSNMQTGVLDPQGVPLTVADLIGMGVNVMSMLTSPVTTIGRAALTGQLPGTAVKGMLTPVEMASPMEVSPFVQEAAQLASRAGISFEDALNVIGGGYYGATSPNSATVGYGGMGDLSVDSVAAGGMDSGSTSAMDAAGGSADLN
jgi:hypothetical protein